MAYVKTIGNATLIAFDPHPVLVTDPWFGDVDSAYFGSWALEREIPATERSEMLAADWVWFSHGHPDHLNPGSLPAFKGKRVLLPDHIGGRIRDGLEAEGFRTEVLPDRRWVELSPRIRVMCIPDYIQDAALLVEVNGRLFLNLNDCGARGSRRFIRDIARHYEHSYLLKISCADADMINLFDPNGGRIGLPPSLDERPTGRYLSHQARLYGAKTVIPFSSFHRYQREDSIWANAHATPLDAYAAGFDERRAQFLPPFVGIDCSDGAVTPIACRQLPQTTRTAAEFGDSWSDQLSPSDESLARDYFLRHETLHRHLGFIDVRVGGRTMRIRFDGPARRGITFEAPAASLMTAIRFEIFDDLLIGNFMRTTLHSLESLYEPPINFIIAKFSDNGRARSEEEVRAYMRRYRDKAGRELIAQLIEDEARRLFRRFVPRSNPVYSMARSVYYRFA